jgi:hypothetical protein
MALVNRLIRFGLVGLLFTPECTCRSEAIR